MKRRYLLLPLLFLAVACGVGWMFRSRLPASFYAWENRRAHYPDVRSLEIIRDHFPHWSRDKQMEFFLGVFPASDAGWTEELCMAVENLGLLQDLDALAKSRLAAAPGEKTKKDMEGVRHVLHGSIVQSTWDGALSTNDAGRLVLELFRRDGSGERLRVETPVLIAVGDRPAHGFFNSDYYVGMDSRTVTTNPATGAVSHWSGMVGETLELRCERNPADDGTFDWWRVENHRTTELLFEGK